MKCWKTYNMDKKNNNHNNKQDDKEEVKEAILEEKMVLIKEAELARLNEEAAKAKEYWDKLLRLQADFENMRKRLERDKEEFIKYANEDLLCSLLNIVDDLERSVELIQEKHEDQTAFLKGVEMILAHMHDMLKKYGVKHIDAKGKTFDPNFHEALMQEDQDNLPENTVVEELQKGYLLNNKVIRTSKVKVSKK
ncbi:nucleotide exchange factor GrpE [bacterium]|nr:MAG: nucleotide exchange factor GrpE [bacterium]